MNAMKGIISLFFISLAVKYTHHNTVNVIASSITICCFVWKSLSWSSTAQSFSWRRQLRKKPEAGGQTKLTTEILGAFKFLGLLKLWAASDSV